MIGNIVVFPSQPQQPPPTLCVNPYAYLMVHSVTKAATCLFWFFLFFFLSCFSLNFFFCCCFLVCALGCQWSFLFPFFSNFFLSLFVLFFFLHAFFLLRSMGENWSKKNRLKRHRVHLTLRVCSRVDDVIVVLV